MPQSLCSFLSFVCRVSQLSHSCYSIWHNSSFFQWSWMTVKQKEKYKHVFKKISNSLKFNNQAIYCLPKYIHTMFIGSHYNTVLKEDHEVIPILRSLLTDNPPTPGKVGHTTGVYIPYYFWNSGVGSFVLQEPDGWKCCETSHGFPSLSKKTRKSDPLQMSQQRQHFRLSCFKTLRFGPAGVWTHDLPLSRPVLSQLS